jgi:hypothetical protein
LEWKVTKNEIEEGGENENVPVRRYSYLLDRENGALDLIPLDKHGMKFEKAKREAVYFVKDDFLFIRYQIEPQRWHTSRPPRVFSSDQNSKTAIVIFRRGPWKWPEKPLAPERN